MHEKVFIHKDVVLKARCDGSFVEIKCQIKTNFEGFIMRPTKSPLQAMALYSAILSQLVGSVLIGLFTGMWLDEQFGTAPLFLIIGLLTGLAIGVWAMLKTVQKFESGDK
jgi:ATP synthase protein I